MREAGGITRRLKIYYKHWQGVVFSINKKKNPAIGQPSQGELNVRPLNCNSSELATDQKTSSTTVYILLLNEGEYGMKNGEVRIKLNITASRISMNLHVMQELNSINIVYCSFSVARIRSNQITKNMTKKHLFSLFPFLSHKFLIKRGQAIFLTMNVW